jgi:protease-4
MLMKTLKHLVMLPWQILTWIRQVLGNLIILAILIAIGSVLFSEAPKPIKPTGALWIEPSGMIVEQETYVDPFVALMEDESQPAEETLLHDITRSIHHAATDKHVTALVIDTSWLDYADPAKILSIGAAIDTFKQSEKPVYAIADSYAQAQYAIASYADEIYMNPMGAVFLTGYGVYPSFYKDAIEKLHITMNIFRVGEYKSFIEPFVRNDMSEEAKANTQLWLDDLWQNISRTMEQQRGLEPGSIAHYISNLDMELGRYQGDGAKLAMETGLVDQLVSRTDLFEVLEEKIGTNNNDELETIDMYDYLDSLPGNDFNFDKKVGVIVASGAILDGEQPAGTIGGDSLASLIADTLDRDDIAALVLRIDSPGGSAFASEIIRDQLAVAQEIGVPVVASFGGMAASGGYWIASTADEIWSSPATITGSIGVFGLVPTFENSLAELGIYSDGVGTTELAGAWYLDRPMNPILKNSIQLEIEHTYATFLDLVSQGRESTPEAIHEVAQGQVWSGNKAHELQLVDNIGELEDAIAAAARLAELPEDYTWEFVEEELSPREQFLQEITSHMESMLRSITQTGPIQNILATVQKKADFLSNYNDPRGVYLYCLDCAVK